MRLIAGVLFNTTCRSMDMLITVVLAFYMGKVCTWILA